MNPVLSIVAMSLCVALGFCLGNLWPPNEEPDDVLEEAFRAGVDTGEVRGYARGFLDGLKKGPLRVPRRRRRP